VGAEENKNAKEAVKAGQKKTGNVSPKNEKKKRNNKGLQAFLVFTKE